MMQTKFIGRMAWCAAALAGAIVCSQGRLHAAADAGEFLLVRRSLDVQPIQLVAINEQSLVLLQGDKGWVTLNLDECIALLNPGSAPLPRTRGQLLLADGQRLPGEPAVSAGGQDDAFSWVHPWLGRMEVPLKMIRGVLLANTTELPEARQADVVLLANGDRQEGLVVALGDPLVLEVEQGAGAGALVEIPLQRVAAVALIAPGGVPDGRRVWFEEGTVLDVQSITVADDGQVRLRGSALMADEAQPAARMGMSQIAAVLLDPQGLVALASLAPTRVEGPATRYAVPRPRVVNDDAPLGVSAMELRGPVIVRYALPEGIDRFVAEVELPSDSRQWGDCELIVRSDDTEVFRARLSAAAPAASINVPLPGRELTIEITDGGNGPIQDHVLLRRGMLLRGR